MTPIWLKNIAVFLTFVAAIIQPANAADALPKASADRMENRIKSLAQFGKNVDGGVDRVAYSDADLKGRAYIISELEALGLSVHIDAAANIFARREGRNPSAKPILFGSHTDSVPGGGNYDGPTGVIAAIEAIELLNTANIQTNHPLELVVFSNEEGGLVGSLAMRGHLKESALSVVNASGRSIADGTNFIGGNIDDIASAKVSKDKYEAFIELHIEQGGLLDEEKLDIGVVEGIVGIGWWDVTIDGYANHGGTTAMDNRRDAMVSAAELTLAINRIVLEMDGRQVATVGRIQAFPGAPNVIPGRVEMSLEIRDLEQSKIDQVYAAIENAAAEIAARTKTAISFAEIDVASEPAPTDPRMRKIIESATQKMAYSYRTMPSGAGHDAQDMVHIAPTGMIFVPSVGGVSHSPNEFTTPEAMAKGADVLVHTILAIDDGALDK